MLFREAKRYEPTMAKLSLNFVIVGASIAGLACAYTLRKAGHNVHVLEASDSLGQVCCLFMNFVDCRCCATDIIAQSPGGVRLPPNATRILNAWGLGDEVIDKANGRCPKILFQSGRNLHAFFIFSD